MLQLILQTLQKVFKATFRKAEIKTNNQNYEIERCQNQFSDQRKYDKNKNEYEA